MRKLTGRLIGFIAFFLVFSCVAVLVILVATGAVDPYEVFPGLPEPPSIDTGQYPLPDPNLPLPDYEIPNPFQTGEYVNLSEQVQRRPLVAQIPAPQQIATAPQVVGANLFLAILMAIIFGLASAELSNILRDEEDRIQAWLRAIGIDKLVAWIGRVTQWGLNRTAVKRGCLTLPLVVLILALYGAIFAFLEEGTSIFSLEGALLALLMAGTVGLVSFSGDFARRIASRLWKAKSKFNFYPANLLLAAASVILSRTLKLSPGIAFGTPGGVDLDLPESQLEKREAVVGILTIAILILIGAFGWSLSALSLYLPDVQFDDRVVSVMATVLTTVQNASLVLFMVSIETAFFELVPLSHSTGRSIFQWSKIVWALFFLPVTFMFNHTLLNPRSGFLDSFMVANVRFMWVILLVLVGLTAGLWFYFNILDDILKKQLGISTGPKNPPPPQYG